MRRIRRILVLVFGGTVLVIGIALIVLPGPAFIVIPAALAILGLEFAWARRWLRRMRNLLPARNGSIRVGERPSRRTPVGLVALFRRWLRRLQKRGRMQVQA